MRERIIEALRKQKFITADQICKIARAFDSGEKKIMLRELHNLVEEGVVSLSARNKYALAEDSGVLKGKVMANPKGFVFVRPETGGEDVFVPEMLVNGAANNDIVQVRVKSQNNQWRRGGSQSRNGEIVKIISRGTSQIVGTFRNNGVYFSVIPDDVRFASEVFIDSKDTLNAKSNEKVVVKITRYPDRRDVPQGIITEILGDAGDLKVSTLAVIRSFGLIEEFPQAVLDEANKVAVEITPEQLKGRKDFTKELTITIDGEDARDFDDAISLTKKGDIYHLAVHIADVANYVKEGGQIDLEAYKRGTSVYFPDHVLPMLPEVLSNGMCSLNPNVNRLTLSVVMDIDKFGEVKDYNICEGVIKSDNRMTYTKVTKMLKGDKEMCKEYAHLMPMINIMAELTTILMKRREVMGNLDFDLPETQIDMNEKGEVQAIYRKPRDLSDRLIEQFMLITNEVVARHMDKLDMPFVYRVHETPTPERMKALAEFVQGLGLTLKVSLDNAKPKELQIFLKEVDGQPYESVINKMTLRCMQKARYLPENLGHFGLACKDYCHFTSPIRRYPDLTIHRIIKYMIHGQLSDGKIEKLNEFVELASEQSSVTERTADDAERAVDDLKKAEYMSKHIGEEYNGIISNVVESGIFVELDNTVEGMILKEFLPEDRYIFDEARVRYVGKRHSYALGDKIAVKVNHVDLVMRKINFVLASNDAVQQNSNQFQPGNRNNGARRDNDPDFDCKSHKHAYKANSHTGKNKTSNKTSVKKPQKLKRY